MKPRTDKCAEIRPEQGQNTQHPANSSMSFLKTQILSVFTLLLLAVRMSPTFNVDIIQNGLVRTE